MIFQHRKENKVTKFKEDQKQLRGRRNILHDSKSFIEFALKQTFIIWALS